MKQAYLADLFGLSDAALVNEFSARLARNNADTAELLAYLAEIDRRKLYLPAGYRSMYAYCVGHFHFSEAAAYKRIHAARLIRRFPVVYGAIAEGRVHLSGLVLLVTHLNPENVEELLAAATHKSRANIERLLAERFPKPDVPALIREITLSTVPDSALAELSPGRVPEQALPRSGSEAANPEAPSTQPDGAVILSPGATVAGRAAGDRPRVMPLSAKTYAVQFTMDEATNDLLRRAQDLLGHRVAPGDLASVFGRALEAYVELLERSKLSATSRPNASHRPARKDSRHIQAHVKRAVWERDGGRCTFISASGHHCEARADLEFDHVLEYARGGEATVEGLRLRCRGHNQYTAEQTYGAGFMRRKRDEAQAAARQRALKQHEPTFSPRA